jgi:hypothetical protein
MRASSWLDARRWGPRGPVPKWQTAFGQDDDELSAADIEKADAS